MRRAATSHATTASHLPTVRHGKSAIVVGASMAGLLAARILAEFYEQVTILERDPLDRSSDPRRGVPQGSHVHIMLVGGANAIEALFPGLFKELVAKGAVTADLSTRDVCWFHHGVLKLPATVPINGYCMTRPFLEQCVRDRVLTLPNVMIRHGCRVQRLLSDAKRTRITGVSLEPVSAGGNDETVEANLVVDATGRGSRAPQWLEELGYAKPRATSVGIHIGYASRFFAPPRNGPDWKILAVYTRAPATRKYGVIQSVEGGRWLVTLTGNLRDYPPADDAGFLEFARQLDHPELYKWIRDATPLSAIATYRFPSHLWRHYERLSRFPDGLLVVGDGICSFNPIYGQGMSVSALEALALQSSLGKGPPDGAFWRRYFQAAARIIRSPWMLGTRADFLYPQTDGIRPLGTSFLNWYTARLYRGCGSDPVIATRFYEVMNFLKEPMAIFDPRVFMRTLAASRDAQARPR